jgi:CDP-diacylglycerol---glycerol-3-phosphate 3-phosphatidyltransferase
MIEGLKPLYNAALYPVAKLFVRTGIHPNAVTFLGVPCSCVSCIFASRGQWIIAGSIIAFGSCLDGLDGLIARIAGKKSAFGAVLDSTCDRITELVWMLGIIIYYMNNPLYHGLGVYLAFLALSGSIMVSYVRARCEGEGISCTRGILQRPERIILLIVCFLAGPKAMIGGLLLISILSYITFIERLVIAFSTEKNAPHR